MRWPTITDYIQGEARYPDDPERLLYFAYGKALTRVDGTDVDDKYRNRYAELLFQNMTIRTINDVTAKLSECAFGMVDRVCLKCHHHWKAPLDVSGFFS
jgi:hypothetical protein